MASRRTTGGFRTHAWAVSALVLAVAVLGAPARVAAQTGTVTGRVTNAATAAPVTAGFVSFCSPTACTSYALNATGNYSATMAAGTYVAYTQTGTATGLVDQVFDHIGCPLGCDPFSARDLGTPIVVASGSTLPGRNFALSPAGTITGRVTNAATGAPLASVRVVVYTTYNRSFVQAQATSNASGVFTVRRVGAGTYFALTESQSEASTHTNMIFGNLHCLASCSDAVATSSGTPFIVISGATTGGIDFALVPGGAISGRVVNSATRAPLPGVRVTASVRANDGLAQARSATTDATGAYTLAGLHAGVYLVASDASIASAISEVHANRPCRARCAPDEIGNGTPVPVTAGTISAIDFGLDPGGSISGTVAAANTATPLQGKVEVYQRAGPGVRLAAQAAITTSGAFVVSGLSTGSYLAVVQAAGYVTTVFNGLPCQPCSPEVIAAGTPISVTSGVNTPGINVVVTLPGSISGTVRTAATNAPVAGARVLAFRSGGANAVAVAGTNAAGAYGFGALSAGTYFLATDVTQFTNQVYNRVDCPSSGCSASFATSQGTPITVSDNKADGFDFSLGGTAGSPGPPQTLRLSQNGGSVQFTWAVPLRGVATGYVLEAGLAPGSTFGTLPVATTTLTVPGVPPGTYFVRVRGTNAAGVGAASNEVTLRVGGGGIVLPDSAEDVEATMINGRLTMTWFPPSAGVEPARYVVEAGSASGASNIGAIAVAGRSFVFDGVPPGFYYLRVRAQNAGGTSPATEDQLVVAGNVAAPPSTVFSFGSTIAGNVVTLNWQPPAFGPVTSYVIEAGSGPGLANLGALDTGSSAPSLVIPGVPRGTYYLRLRAVNALGTSPASTAQNDLVLVVP